MRRRISLQHGKSRSSIELVSSKLLAQSEEQCSALATQLSSSAAQIIELKVVELARIDRGEKGDGTSRPTP